MNIYILVAAHGNFSPQAAEIKAFTTEADAEVEAEAARRRFTSSVSERWECEDTCDGPVWTSRDVSTDVGLHTVMIKHSPLLLRKDGRERKSEDESESNITD